MTKQEAEKAKKRRSERTRKEEDRKNHAEIHRIISYNPAQISANEAGAAELRTMYDKQNQAQSKNTGNSLKPNQASNREGRHQAANSDKVMPYNNGGQSANNSGTQEQDGSTPFVQAERVSQQSGTDADDIAIENVSSTNQVPPTLLNSEQPGELNDRRQPSVDHQPSTDPGVERKPTSTQGDVAHRETASPTSPTSPGARSTESL